MVDIVLVADVVRQADKIVYRRENIVFCDVFGSKLGDAQLRLGKQRVFVAAAFFEDLK